MLSKAHVDILEWDSFTLVVSKVKERWNVDNLQGWTGDLTTKKSPAIAARDRQGQQLNYFVDGIKGSQSRGAADRVELRGFVVDEKALSWVTVLWQQQRQGSSLSNGSSKLLTATGLAVSGRCGHGHKAAWQ
ncbi:hypothetical protein NL676_007074 [Syzygium grande]|nr:hypothetical protein NL676_007074 [Syzygium grande]